MAVEGVAGYREALTGRDGEGFGHARGFVNSGAAAGGMAVNTAGGSYIADFFNNMFEGVTPTGTMSIDAGTGKAGVPTPGPATDSDLGSPDGVNVDLAGNLYIVDPGNELVEEVAI